MKREPIDRPKRAKIESVPGYPLLPIRPKQLAAARRARALLRQSQRARLGHP